MSVAKPWSSGKKWTSKELSKLKQLLLVFLFITGIAPLVNAGPPDPDGRRRVNKKRLLLSLLVAMIVLVVVAYGTGLTQTIGGSSKHHHSKHHHSKHHRHHSNPPSNSPSNPSSNPPSNPPSNNPPVNAAPVLGGVESSALSYDTGSGPANVTSTITVTDMDSTNLNGATVRISSGYENGHDTLSFTDQNGITGSWDSTSGTLTLSGTASKADYQTALRDVQYSASDPTPSGSRTVEFQVDDGQAQNHASNTVSRNITINHVNHASVANDDTGSTNEDTSTNIDVLGNDTDPDNDTLHVASVDTTGTKGSVTINSDNTITYDPNKQFESLGQGQTDTDTFTYKANDGTTDSNSATVTVTITGVNDAPVLSGIESSPLSYDTGSGPVAVTSSIQVKDADSTNISKALVKISNGYNGPSGNDGEDKLDFTNQNGISGSFDASTGTLTLSGSATLADYQTALRSVQYEAGAPTQSGSRTISFQVTDDEGANALDSSVVTRDITINHVNHAPVVTNDTSSTDEDHATSPINVLSNDSDVDGDTLHVASVDTTGTKGSVTINSDNTITYDPNKQFESLGQGQTDTDTFTYKANDGTTDSNSATVTVTITGVNDAPVLGNVEGNALAYSSDQPATTISSTITVNDVDSTNLTGATVQITTGYVKGKDTLSFTNQNGISGSFDATSGTLTLTGSSSVANYQTALQSVKFQGDNAAGTKTASRTISFQVDDGAAQNHASNTVTRNIDVTHVNQAPVAGNDSFTANNQETVGNTMLAVGGTPPSEPHVQISGNLLDNDTDADSSHSALTASFDPSTNTAPSGSKVTVNKDGSFTYVPPPGTTGNQSFTYTVSDNDSDTPRTGTGTVTVKVAKPVVWYVDNSLGTNGNGTSDAPFNGLSSLNAANGTGDKDGSGDIIFLYQGNGSYTGGLPLESNEQLIGQPQGLTVTDENSQTRNLVAAGGSNPTITNTSGDAIDLASGVDVERVDANSASGIGIGGSNVNTATVGSNTTVSGNGGGVGLSGGNGDVSIGSNITNASGNAVSIASRSGGTTSLSGSINASSGTGVSLTNNTGATVTFTGGLTLSTGGNTAFSATGGGTVNVTGSNSTLATTTGTALNVANTNIGGSGLTFKSISAGNGSNGPTNGIVLNSTGTSSGLTVTGGGSTAQGGDASGGTIQKTTGDAISLSNTKSPSFNDINVQNPAKSGVRGTGVTNFSVTNSTIQNAGESAANQNAPLDYALAFNNDPTGGTKNIEGTLTVTNNKLLRGYAGGLKVIQKDGTISNATITNNQITQQQSTDTPGDGIGFNLNGTATNVASLTKAAITGNTLTSLRGSGITVIGGNSSTSTAPSTNLGIPTSTPGTGTNIIDISNNSIVGDPKNGSDTSPQMQGPAIEAGPDGRGQSNFNITNNGTQAQPIRNFRGIGIGTGGSGDGTNNVKVDNNYVQPNSSNDLNSTGIGTGADKNQQTDSSILASPTTNAIVTNNTVSNSNGFGIRSLTSDSDAHVNLRLQNNNVGAPADPSFSSISVESGSDNNNTSYHPTTCAQVQGNTAAAGSGADSLGNTTPGIIVRKRGVAILNFVGLGNNSSAAQTETYLEQANPNSGAGGGFYAGKKVAVFPSSGTFGGCSLGF